MLATVEVNVYGVLALAVAGGALWIAAKVFYHTYVIITITTHSDINRGDKGWYLKDTGITIGSVKTEGNSTVIEAGGKVRRLPPRSWNTVDGTFLSMIDGWSLRGRKSNEWLVLARRNSLPRKVLEHIDERRPSAFYRG